MYFAMQEEFFGPILTMHVYPAKKFVETLDLCDKTSNYALTGSIFAREREIIELASKKLINAAGNFYINDKPTGAVVGQQPFGGSRGSGTNDKAGSVLNLIRWLIAPCSKGNFCPSGELPVSVYGERTNCHNSGNNFSSRLLREPLMNTKYPLIGCSDKHGIKLIGCFRIFIACLQGCLFKSLSRHILRPLRLAARGNS